MGHQLEFLEKMLEELTDISVDRFGTRCVQRMLRIGTPAQRQMILATDEAARREALDKLLPYQRDDFLQLFTIMADLPVTIRL